MRCLRHMAIGLRRNLKLLHKKNQITRCAVQKFLGSVPTEIKRKIECLKRRCR